MSLKKIMKVTGESQKVTEKDEKFKWNFLENSQKKSLRSSLSLLGF